MSKQKSSNKTVRSSKKKVPRKYRVIYIDPPWHYSRSYDGRRPIKSKVPYPTLRDKKIINLPIGELADNDCALFLWTTLPKLKIAMAAMEAWGFEYTTVGFVWVKLYRNSDKIVAGLGYWTCTNAEVVLIGKKGRPNPRRCKAKQIIISPRGEHSAKPPEVRERIVHLMGNVPRIEIFARERVPGWDAMGNEIDGKDIRDALRDHGIIFPEETDLKKAA